MTVDVPPPTSRPMPVSTSAFAAPQARRWSDRAIVQLTLTRIRETVREPGVMFWVFGFPILLSLGLGMAFRNRGPEPVYVGVLDGPGATAIEGALTAAHVRVERLTLTAARERLRSGKIALLVVPPAAGLPPAPATGTPPAPVTYQFDPTRGEARATPSTMRCRGPPVASIGSSRATCWSRSRGPATSTFSSRGSSA